jgi:hypothetical protein
MVTDVLYGGFRDIRRCGRPIDGRPFIDDRLTSIGRRSVKAHDARNRSFMNFSIERSLGEWQEELIGPELRTFVGSSVQYFQCSSSCCHPNEH